MNKEKVYSEEADRGVLGSTMINPSKVLGICSEKMISPSSFYTPAHRHMFAQILEMENHGEVIDLITVGERLKENGLLDVIGGYQFIEGLIDSTPTSEHAEYYMEIVREKQIRREIIDEATLAIDRCKLNEDESAKSILSRVESALFGIGAKIVTAVKSLFDIGEEFITKCEEGKSGHLPHFCNEWTCELGMLSNEIVFVHAPRSTGKTSLVIQWHRYAEMCGVKGVFFSLESTKKAIYPRYLAQEGQVNTFAMRNNLPSNHPYWAKARAANISLRAMNLIIKDGDWTIENIRSASRQLVSNGARYAMIDNLVCIKTEKDFQNQQAKYMYLMEQVRSMRNELEIPIIILAHPNVEGNIKHAGELEDMADVVIFMKDVVREEERKGGDPDEALSRMGLFRRYLEDYEAQIAVKIQKNREGPTPLLELIFDQAMQTFYPADVKHETKGEAATGRLLMGK